MGSVGNTRLEIRKSPFQPVVPVDARLPAEQSAGARDVGLAYLRIVLRQRPIVEDALAAGQGEDLLGEFEDGHLAGVAEVDRLVKVGVEQADDALDEIVHVAEGARLRAVAVDGQRLTAQGLAHEVGQYAAVVESHPWAER